MTAARFRRRTGPPYLRMTDDAVVVHEDDHLFQLVEERLGGDEVARSEAFGEPGVERGEQIASLVVLALALPALSVFCPGTPVDAGLHQSIQPGQKLLRNRSLKA